MSKKPSNEIPNTSGSHIRDQDAVRALYQSDPDREWHRLERHRTEFAVTLRALKDHLPPPPARVLDCGSGPGRYALTLTRMGYEVTLFDLSSESLALAREGAADAGLEMAGYEVGTALDVLHVLGVEGVVSTSEERINALRGEAWTRWVDVNYRIAHDPYNLGGVEHILAVCRKPAWRGVLRRIAQILNKAGIDYAVVGGTSLALHGLPVPVNDLDIEMSSSAEVGTAQDRLSAYVNEPVTYREGVDVRSHFGRLCIDGVSVDIMAELEWRRENRWVPSFFSTRDTVVLDGAPVTVLTLEEETLSALRRGKLRRAALALPHCDPDRFQALLRRAQCKGAF